MALPMDGGITPYDWELAMHYNFQQLEAAYPDIQGDQLTPNGTLGGFVTQNIDFTFPFYNKQHDSITVHIDGFLMFNEITGRHFHQASIEFHSSESWFTETHIFQYLRKFKK